MAGSLHARRARRAGRVTGAKCPAQAALHDSKCNRCLQPGGATAFAGIHGRLLYNTREFFHGRSAQALRSIKWFFLAAGFVLPAGLLASLEPTRGVLLLSVVVQFAGLIAERWFFFAQAYHPQNLYYQAVS